MHPLLHPARRIVPCITVHRISQLSPHVLIQSMRTSFCIYRLISRQNTGYNSQIWAIGARNELLGVILSDGGFCSSALFSLLMTAFRGRHQRFIMECTLRWTIAGYRPQCEVSSTDGLALHSDQGSQYTSKAYFNLTQAYHVSPSMSSSGCPYDNATMENFFGTLKTECLYRARFSSRAEAERLVAEYVHFCNFERISLKNGLTPLEIRGKTA